MGKKISDKPKYLIESEIAIKKQKLAATDYQALKFAEVPFLRMNMQR